MKLFINFVDYVCNILVNFKKVFYEQSKTRVDTVIDYYSKK